jgi:cell division septum initiation protein DivIVA
MKGRGEITLQANRVYFTEELYGYDKAQVDSYIQLLTLEYREMWREYEATLQAGGRKERRSDGTDARTAQPGVLY